MALLVLLTGCSAPDDGPIQYGPTSLMSRSSPPPIAPGDPVPLQSATPGIIVAPVGSNAMCQLGMTAAQGQGENQVRYAIVGKECAASVGTQIENVDARALLGTIAAVVRGGNGTWSAVAVKLEPGVGWSVSAPGAVANAGDKVKVMGIGERFRVEIEPNRLLRLSGFTSPAGRSGAAVLDSEGQIVAISAGDGAAAIPISEFFSATAATPGLEGLVLL
ncbi:hypothetical protein [Tsukamurella strandjordii]|uniref:hypothetical protein n=1 Tax=Tsukamurella strandjordii TaxID=147577 RepID=UPI0031D846EA